mmetsp:Transcript_50669/g.115141  ORF Transcript_50669/g.115141 Transcript_50669/m.115141 type:complete len:93 (+) Transcript_50669:145-423(+)
MTLHSILKYEKFLEDFKHVSMVTELLTGPGLLDLMCGPPAGGLLRRFANERMRRVRTDSAVAGDGFVEFNQHRQRGAQGNPRGAQDHLRCQE